MVLSGIFGGFVICTLPLRNLSFSLCIKAGSATALWEPCAGLVGGRSEGVRNVWDGRAVRVFGVLRLSIVGRSTLVCLGLVIVVNVAAGGGCVSSSRDWWTRDRVDVGAMRLTGGYRARLERRKSAVAGWSRSTAMACRIGGGRLRGVGGWRWAGRKRRGSLVETWRRRKGHDEWDIQIGKRENRDARDENARCRIATATYLQGLTDAAVIRQTSRLIEAPEGSALARGERFARLVDDHCKKAGRL